MHCGKFSTPDEDCPVHGNPPTDDLVRSLRHAAEESGRYTNANRRLIEAAAALQAKDAALGILKAKLHTAQNDYVALTAERDRAQNDCAVAHTVIARLRKALDEFWLRYGPRDRRSQITPMDEFAALTTEQVDEIWDFDDRNLLHQIARAALVEQGAGE